MPHCFPTLSTGEENKKGQFFFFKVRKGRFCFVLFCFLFLELRSSLNFFFTTIKIIMFFFFLGL